MTGVNYITNNRGQKTAVQISMKQWNNMQMELKKLELLEDLKQAFSEMKQCEKDKLETLTTKQLLALL